MNERNITASGGGSEEGIIHESFDSVTSLENLFAAWREFRRGKRNKWEVQEFEFEIEQHLLGLHEELREKTYCHGSYSPFYIEDPKPRHIHKASVRDRVLHQAVFRALYPVFDKGFIHDSYSCRIEKGTHRAVARLETFARKASRNHRRAIFALKCDIRKFFDTIDQRSLIYLIEKKVHDPDFLWLISNVIHSFETARGKGLPLGNVTSQLFANIYLNELDQFIKRVLKVRLYVRYCDDFVILGENKERLFELIPRINTFLEKQLSLKLHERKITVRKCAQGIDFLGYVVLPHHRTLRTKTKRRMLRKITERRRELEIGTRTPESFSQSLQSYLGVLKHCRGFKLERRLKLLQ